MLHHSNLQDGARGKTVRGGDGFQQVVFAFECSASPSLLVRGLLRDDLLYAALACEHVVASISQDCLCGNKFQY